MDPQSRVRTGVERVRLVRSAASWKLASRWAGRAQDEVDQGWCRPAAEAADAVVGRGLLGGLEKGEAYSVRLLASSP